jgi:hypothetical protein
MECGRCRGYIVREVIREGMLTSEAWRCIVCGDVTDRVIRRHRALAKPPSPSRARTHIHVSGLELVWKERKWKIDSQREGVS